MQRVAVGWLAWRLTESGLWLGIIAFADLAPALFIGPIAGTFADRHSRLKVILVCQSLAMSAFKALRSISTPRPGFSRGTTTFPS